MGAAYFQQISEQSVAAEHNASDSEEVYEHFGSLYKCMVSLFCSVTGGNDWMLYAAPLRRLGFGELWFLIFLFYVSVLTVGVLNVVTGIFVDSAVCTRTEDEVVKNWKDDMDRTAWQIKKIFMSADSDHSGTVTLMELMTQLQNPWVSAYFAGLDIDPNEAKIIFTLMDTDNDGAVSIEEFIDGTLKLKGHAKSVDMIAMMYDQAQFQMKFNKLCSYIEDNFRELKDVLSATEPPTPRLFPTLEHSLAEQSAFATGKLQKNITLSEHDEVERSKPDGDISKVEHLDEILPR